MKILQGSPGETFYRRLLESCFSFCFRGRLLSASILWVSSAVREREGRKGILLADFFCRFGIVTRWISGPNMAYAISRSYFLLNFE